MKKMVMSIFTRTPLHVGAGNSVGVVDMPVQRERHTRIPIIPGSSLKGVLADLWNDNYTRSGEGKKLFGEDDNSLEARSGTLLTGEARVLAFPLRSAKGMFAWVTSPLALKRFQRDSGFDVPEVSTDLDDMDALAPVSLRFQDPGKESLILEEYVFSRKGGLPGGLADELISLLPGNALWKELNKHLVILSDSMFSYFAENSCDIVTRIHVDNETGTVKKGAMFNQEQVPSETMFYSVLMDRETSGFSAASAIKEKLKDYGNMIQVGGDASIGLGLCDVEVVEK